MQFVRLQSWIIIGTLALCGCPSGEVRTPEQFAADQLVLILNADVHTSILPFTKPYEQKLSFDGTTPTPDDLAVLAAGFGKLESLSFHRCELTEAHSNALSGFSHLDILQISESNCNSFVIPSDIDLHDLKINICKLPDKFLQSIFNHHSLEHLALIGCGLTDNELENIDSLSQLFELRLMHNSLQGEFIQQLFTTDSLKILSLNNNPIAPEWITELKRGKSIVRLALSGTPVTDAHIQTLTRDLHNLRVLALDHSIVSDAVFEFANSLPDLQELSVKSTRVSSQATRNFIVRHPSIIVCHDFGKYGN